MTDPSSERVRLARAVASTDEARLLYDGWADDYDRDVFGRMGVTGSARVAELFAQAVDDRSTPIVDLGCGTGAVIQHLADLGFADVVGIDLSPQMLSAARRRGVHRPLVAADLNAPPLRPRSFSASVSAGTFLAGHLGGEAVAGLVDLLRPGAALVWSVTPNVWPEVRQALHCNGVDILRDDAEPIRPGTDDRSHMVVGRMPG